MKKSLFTSLWLVIAASSASTFSFRHLEVTDECRSATAALYDNAGLTNAYNSLLLDVDQSGNCNNQEDDGTSTCVMNFESLNSMASFKSACASAGGTTYQMSTTMDCNMNAGGGFVLEYNDMIDCIHPSCNMANVEDEFEQIVKRQDRELETEWSAVCTYDMTDSAAASVTVTSLGIVISSLLLGFMIV